MCKCPFTVQPCPKMSGFVFVFSEYHKSHPDLPHQYPAIVYCGLMSSVGLFKWFNRKGQQRSQDALQTSVYAADARVLQTIYSTSAFQRHLHPLHHISLYLQGSSPWRSFRCVHDHHLTDTACFTESSVLHRIYCLITRSRGTARSAADKISTDS